MFQSSKWGKKHDLAAMQYSSVSNPSFVAVCILHPVALTAVKLSVMVGLVAVKLY